MNRIFIIILSFVICMIFILQILLYLLPKEYLIQRLNKFVPTDFKVSDIDVNLLKRRIAFSNLRLANPDGFGSEDILWVRKVYIDIALIPIFFKKIYLRRVILKEPYFLIETDENGSLNVRLLFKDRFKQESREVKYKGAVERNDSANFICKKIKLQDASVEYVNYKIHPTGASFLITQLNGYISDIQKVTLNKDKMPTQFELEGVITPISGQQGGMVRLSGIGDFLSKKINFDAKIKIRDFQLPYFRDFFTKEIMLYPSKGRMDISSNIRCRDNVLDGIQAVEIKDLRLAVADNVTPETNVFQQPINRIIDFFSGYKGKFEFVFHIDGTLSHPTTDLKEVLIRTLKGYIRKYIAGQISKFSRQISKDIEDGQIKDIDQIKKMGKELLKEIFKK